MFALSDFLTSCTEKLKIKNMLSQVDKAYSQDN